MKKLLHVSASPRGARSQSLAVAAAFIDAYKETNPGDAVDTLDLWSHALPALDAHALDAKYAILRKLDHTPAQAAAWAPIVAEAQRLASYDKLLFSVPMWNWSIPFVLKHYIDIVTQPGLLFDWSPATGYVGRLQRPAAVVYSSSFAYDAAGPMDGFDHQKPYIAHWLRVIGCTTAADITIAPTAAPPDALHAIREAAFDRAREAARHF